MSTRSVLPDRWRTLVLRLEGAAQNYGSAVSQLPGGSAAQRALGEWDRRRAEFDDALLELLEALEAWKQLAATLGAEGAAAFRGDRPYLEIRMRIDAELLELGRMGVVDVTLADIRGRCEQAIVEKFGAVLR